MAEDLSMSLEGDKALLRKLRHLEGKARRRATTKMLRAGAPPLVRAARKAAPKGPTGNLRRSMGKREKSYEGGAIKIVVIGARWPLGAHGHLVERGTKARTTKKGQYRGIMPASHFFERAIKQALPTAQAAMMDRLRRAIIEEAQRGR